MELPKIEDVKARLAGEKVEEAPKDFGKMDLGALFLGALNYALHRRNTRLAWPKRLRRAQLMMGANPYKRNYTIARVKRAQYQNAKNKRRVYIRSHHGGHF